MARLLDAKFQLKKQFIFFEKISPGRVFPG